MPRDVVLHGALLEGTGTQMDKPPLLFGHAEMLACPMWGLLPDAVSTGEGGRLCRWSSSARAASFSG